ncbi:hypothetical protein NDU88_007380 [Pleurodeles waltl]|uniref:Uncharacterized protein n=1 Tax=Pleurodeles waltl TaxID=8319 RepID=A0AAV7VSN9_PLEWA|nr:hypothetical protein NDU88_007380 [Pleurodeles waltl]
MKRGRALAAEELLQHGSTAAESNTCQQCAAPRLSWGQHAKREARTCSRPRTWPGREERNQKWAWAGWLKSVGNIAAASQADWSGDSDKSRDEQGAGEGPISWLLGIWNVAPEKK